MSDGLQFEDLGALLASGLEPPPQLVERLVVERQVHWLSGHPANGKTTVGLWIAVQAMSTGTHVIWLDWEAGPRETLLRLIALGAEEAAIRECFHYAYSPAISADDFGFALLNDALGTWPGSLVVFDSASKALSTAGLDENNPAEATRWTTKVVMPLRERGATAIVIDHVPKGATSSTAYARGAGSKLADTEVAWYVQAVEPFNREQRGELRLTKHKDRSGVLPREVRLAVGDGQGGLPIKVLCGGAASDKGASDAKMRARIIARLQKEGKPIRTTQLGELVTGKKEVILATARQMAEDFFEPVSASAGPNGSILYAYDESAAASVSKIVPSAGS